MKYFLIILLGIGSIFSVCHAEEKLELKDQKAKDSYGLGYDFGANLKRQGVEIDVDVLFSAVRDALEGKKPVLSSEEIRDTLLQLRKRVIVLQDRRFRERAAENLEEGKAFLALNKTKEGVKTLPSGLQYKVLAEGSGKTPKETDNVTVNYRGTLIDGTEFDGSYKRDKPETFRVNGVIPGWTEALQLMKVGTKAELAIPPELAYGSNGPLANQVLLFDVELLGAIATPAEEKGK